MTAVQLDRDTEGFGYRKWRAEQRCKRGDWIVCNDGETYTVDQKSFRDTYRRIGPGRYVKVGVVRAERAEHAGAVETRENVTRYRAGDYLVYNNEDGTDGYAMSAERFHRAYEPVEDLDDR